MNDDMRFALHIANLSNPPLVKLNETKHRHRGFFQEMVNKIGVQKAKEYAIAIDSTMKLILSR